MTVRSNKIHSAKILLTNYPDQILAPHLSLREDFSSLTFREELFDV
jgi:hypothetical protein